MSTSTLQYLDCQTCGPHSLHDYGKCKGCGQAFYAPVTRPDIRRYNNSTTRQMEERHRKRSKAAVKRALTGPRGNAGAKSWVRRYEVAQ